ncbi:MAG: FliA/WhiG family RNA polymerase sigma factor [Chloroherpetonaceae bacterium]|nr:FliA/WhiG family RNA polymerase sigma factor [Chthonomonadaceae bacterium]MDW8206583.1 FliA/WhiG family RNA polymerase sigma factor [Chloroherpetonaceae bacterium]
MTSSEIQESWRLYKQHADARARDRLIQHFAYLVKITAGRVISNLPPSLERDDLVSAGILGLIKAVDQFDLTRQVKFETYAIALIRGAILEMLREDDWVPRSIRERVKQLERTYMHLEVQLGRPATEAEVAAALEMEPEDFQKLLLETGRTSLLSLEDILVGSDGNEKLHLADVIQDETNLPSLEAEMHERQRILGRSIDRLPERERLVIALYYYEGLTFKEIGKILSISESRVYQLHTQAVLRLRGYLQRDTELFQ